jgi:hypothetical protein
MNHESLAAIKRIKIRTRQSWFGKTIGYGRFIQFILRIALLNSLENCGTQFVLRIALLDSFSDSPRAGHFENCLAQLVLGIGLPTSF